MVAVGESAINLTPVPVKEFAIAHFGSHDKAALVTGILVLLAAFAALIGVLAVRPSSRRSPPSWTAPSRMGTVRCWPSG